MLLFTLFCDFFLQGDTSVKFRHRLAFILWSVWMLLVLSVEKWCLFQNVNIAPDIFCEKQLVQVNSSGLF